MFRKTLPPPAENPVVYATTWKKYGRGRQTTDDNSIRRMRFAWLLSKATETHSECVIRAAFARKLWLLKRVSLLRLYYTACLVVLLSAV